MTDETLLPVIQADRDAAADWLLNDYGNEAWASDVRSGEVPSELATAFAAHRLRHSPPTADNALADELERRVSVWRQATKESHPATYIHNLAGSVDALLWQNLATFVEALRTSPPSEQPDEWNGALTAEEQARIDAAWEKHKAAGPNPREQWERDVAAWLRTNGASSFYRAVWTDAAERIERGDYRNTTAEEQG